MAKKKTNSTSRVQAAAKNSAEVQNSFGGAMGFNAFSPGVGFPGAQGSPFSEPLSSTTPLFKNLRWYLISNFRQLLSEAYVEISLFQTVVDVPVDDALRGGVLIKSKQLDESQIQELQVSLDRDDDLNIVGQAAKWNRLFGGAGIIILNGDQDPSEPLDVKSLSLDSPAEFRAVDMWELFWDKQNTEGYDPAIQTQNFEHYNYYGEKLHKTRVMRLKGLNAPSFIRPRLRGWGFSVAEGLVRSLNQYLKATDLAYEVLDEFKIDVYKMKNLVNTLLSPNGQMKVAERTQLANWIKNYQRAIVMDSEDDYLQKQLSFAGLAEVMTGIRMQIASDMRMPITKLFGTSVSAGFQTDQNDMENYNAMVESQVRNKIKYDILRVCEIKSQILFGYIPDDLSLTFKPLRELNAEQEENVKTQKFNRLIQAKQAGELTTLEFRDACNKGNLFDVTLDTTEDLLNPEDPEVTEVVKEGDQANPDEVEESRDLDDPGANRVDTQKVRATEVGGAGKEPVEKKKNSVEYEKAAYEADGGDGWINPARKAFFENPLDKALWAKCVADSTQAFGQEKWQFTMYLYQKQGGKFR